MSKVNEVVNFASNIITALIDGAEKANAIRIEQDTHKFSDSIETQIMQRDIQYTELLRHFVSISKTRNTIREWAKWIMSLCILLASIVFLFIFWKIVNKVLEIKDVNQIVDSIPLLITSIVSFISVVIAVPLVLLKYLFSNKEDEYITKIILHTQEHDTSGRQWTLDYNSKDKQISDTQKYNINGINNGQFG